jgi:hypothetical protein
MNKRNGLALLVALMMTGCLACLALSLSCLLAVETSAVTAGGRLRLLRHAAESAARVGLGELQASLGPDASIDYPSGDGSLIASRHGLSRTLSGSFSEGVVTSSWCVDDLSLRNDAAAAWVDGRQASGWALSYAGRAKLPRTPRAPTDSQRRAIDIGGPMFLEPAPASHDSWQVRGLLTDPVRGGWKANLRDEAALVAEMGADLAKALSDVSAQAVPAAGYPIRRSESSGRVLALVPVLLDIRLSLGFFNARSDGRHRLRFHGSAVFWNPLTVPVLAGPKGRMFLVEVVGAPEVAITNLDAGASFVADLDDCPLDDFGIFSQGLRERGLWFWAEIADSSTSGMSGRGLLPGEVYAFVNPPPESQPQGLSRILTKTTWKMDRTYHGPGWRRPASTVFLPTDRIEIALRFRDKVGIRLRPYAGEPARDVAIADYPSKPMLSLEGIVFPDVVVRTTGEDYSREDSAGYLIGERRACLRLRLRPRPEEEWWAAAAAGTLSRSAWNLADSADAEEWALDHPLLSALDVVDHDGSPLFGPFWDRHPGRHEASAPEAFSSIRIRDYPTPPWVSVGAFRHLESAGGTRWLECLDRCFVATGGATSADTPFMIANSAASAAAPPASALLVAGPFNVNSTDPRAWESFLRGSIGVFQADPGGPFDPQAVSGALFFTRPGGAVLADWGAGTPGNRTDAQMPELSPEALAALSRVQSVRRLEDGKIARFAREIVAGQSALGWPYASLRAFAESGLLAQALAKAEVDAVQEKASPFLPIRLRQEDLLESWAPVLTVRGDTFKVTGRSAGLGGSVTCELVVQRLPPEHPAAHLGRRFAVTSVRFR